MADDAATISLLADHPALVREVGVLRWTEWGYDDPSPQSWIAITAREAGRDDLPITWVVTGGDAADYYRACGWTDVERLVTSREQLPSTVLVYVLPE